MDTDPGGSRTQYEILRNRARNSIQTFRHDKLYWYAICNFFTWNSFRVGPRAGYNMRIKRKLGSGSGSGSGTVHGSGSGVSGTWYLGNYGLNLDLDQLGPYGTSLCRVHNTAFFSTDKYCTKYRY